MLSTDIKEFKKERPEGIISQQGACRFCGQFKKIDTMMGWLEEKCDELATEQCNCSDALDYTRRKQQKENAHALIDTLFVKPVYGEEERKTICQDQADFLHRATDFLAEDKGEKIQYDFGDGFKAVISITAKGKIRVTRTDNTTEAMEA